ALYGRELEGHGHRFDGRVIPVARFLAIASSDSEAAEVARQGAGWLLKTYIDPTRFGIEADPIQHYLDSVIIHGIPDRVIDQIYRLRDQTALDYLIGAPLSHQTFLSFTERVLPKFL